MTLLNNQIIDVETQLRKALMEQDYGTPKGAGIASIAEFEAQLEALYDESQAERRFEISSIYAS
jgi:hypothetical protein